MIQFLLDGCDASWISAPNDIFDLFWKFQFLFFYDFFIFNDVDCDVVINKAEDIKIHKVNGAFDFDNIFFAHFAAPRVFDDSYAAVQLIQMKIFIDVHALSGLDVVQNKALGDTSYV